MDEIILKTYTTILDERGISVATMERLRAAALQAGIDVDDLLRRFGRPWSFTAYTTTLTALVYDSDWVAARNAAIRNCGPVPDDVEVVIGVAAQPKSAHNGVWLVKGNAARRHVSWSELSRLIANGGENPSG